MESRKSILLLPVCAHTKLDRASKIIAEIVEMLYVLFPGIRNELRNISRSLLPQVSEYWGLPKATYLIASIEHEKRQENENLPLLTAFPMLATILVAVVEAVLTRKLSQTLSVRKTLGLTFALARTSVSVRAGRALGAKRS